MPFRRGEIRVRDEHGKPAKLLEINYKDGGSRDRGAPTVEVTDLFTPDGQPVNHMGDGSFRVAGTGMRFWTVH